MMRRVILTILIITNIIAVAGCWDLREASSLAIISGLAVDYDTEKKYRLITQMVNPAAVSANSEEGGATFQKAYRNSAAAGDSLYEAFNNQRTILGTHRYLGGTEVIIISEGLARDKGIHEVLDHLERNPDVRLDAWVVIGRSDITDLMDVTARIIYSPTQRIRNIIADPKENSGFAPLKFAEFIRLMQSESTQAYTVGVESRPNPSIPSEAGHGILDGNIPEPLHDIALNGTAVFRQDKLAGWLDGEESRGLLWLRGDFKVGDIILEDPINPGKKAAVKVVSGQSKLEPEIRNGQIYMQVDIKVESILEEAQGKINLGETSAVAQLEKAQEEAVRNQITAVLQKAQQEYNLDVFGFGEAIHRSYPREWKNLKTNWEETFPDVQVDIRVKSKIRNTSMINKSAEPGQER